MTDDFFGRPRGLRVDDVCVGDAFFEDFVGFVEEFGACIDEENACVGVGDDDVCVGDDVKDSSLPGWS